jgi:hypothetical protein
MRKMILSVAITAVALLTASAGTAAPPQSVKISVSSPSVVYGSSVTLTGKVSSSKAGEKVDVLAEPMGASSMSALATVDTTSGGHWSDVVKPTIETGYQAQWKSATSSTVTVKVRPQITLSAVNLATGRFSTKVTAARAFAGKFVLVQRMTNTGVTTLKKVTLDSSSSAAFRVRLHHGRSRLRVVMPTSQAAPGYITGVSNVLTVRR